MLGIFRRKKAKTNDEVVTTEAIAATDSEQSLEERPELIVEKESIADDVSPSLAVDLQPSTDEAEVISDKSESKAEAVYIDDETLVKEFSEPPEAEQDQKKPSFFQKLKSGLKKTRQSFGNGLGRLLLGKKKIDDDVLEELETQLLLADIGVDATQKISSNLANAVKRKELADGNALMAALKNQLIDILKPLQHPLPTNQTQQSAPYVILMIGVNGAGKTTTIGKIAKQLQAEGKKVMLAAGDTFRAAAVEQLEVWGKRNEIPVIAQHTGADSASVIFDAFNAAKARGIDVLIADTAGRLHTQMGLMEELKKIKRVMQKIDAAAPHEVMLVLDASIGQNALSQAKQFHEAIGVTGLTMTKLDGTAKGGILFAIANQLELPFRYIGIGESISDLRPFEANAFVDALFEEQVKEHDNI